MSALFVYIFLGLIQGLTEPIPVSSSGHILIFKTLLDKVIKTDIDYTTFAIITNFGSLLAIIIIFRQDIINLVQGFFGYISGEKERYKIEFRYCLWVVIASIPAGILGLVATKFSLLVALEENIKFLGFMLLLTGILLYLIKDYKGKKTKEHITFIDALKIGFMQMIAIIPGLSRSGSTIIGGLSSGLERETAFNFSFILYIPISIATSILGISKLFDMNINLSTLILYIIATIVSFIFTYIATKIFSKIVKEGKLIYFSIYCFIIGLLVIIFL